MNCRVSGKPLEPLINLGDIYLNNFVDNIDRHLPSERLAIGVSPEFGLAQLMCEPDLDLLYKDYWYRSGTNEGMRESLGLVALKAQEWRKLDRWDIILDIGCNDGFGLTCFPDRCTKVGIDPAKNLREEAKGRMDYHYPDYFSADVYERLMGNKQASIITSIAMFYDLPDPIKFVRDVKKVLKDDGVWVCQMSYTPLMLEQNAFDNICHEHLEYYTFQSFENVIRSEGMKVVDVELNSVNGGSFCCVVAKMGMELDPPRFVQDVAAMRVNALRDWDGHYGRSKWDEFGKRVIGLRESTLDLLHELKKKKKRVYGYGASTKGNTLLQYYGLDRGLITAIAERQPQKYGKLTVGSWIPIISDEQMRMAGPDYLVVFPWHFIDGFVEREHEFLEGGGRFIVPLPQLEVIGG